MHQKENSSIWVYLLRLLGGYLNVTAIILFSRVVGGQTGNISKIAIAYVEGNFNTVFQLIAIAFTFILGGFISGLFKPLDREEMGSRYGFLFVGIGLIFILFSIMGFNSVFFLLYLVLVLGVTNGITLYCKGMVVKTTIITGTLTDIGITLSEMFKGASLDKQKLTFHCLNLFCFLLGATLAAFIGIRTTWNMVSIAGLLELVIGFYFVSLREVAFGTEKEGTL